MKDIDFDELDRAVSSALGNGSETKTPDTNPSEPAPSPDAVPPAPTAPLEAKSPQIVPSISIPPTSPTVSLPQASPALRRGGRFMDVVHPSSDMKSSVPIGPRVPKRTLGPISEDLKVAPTSVVSAPANEPATNTGSFPTLDTLSTESSPRVDTTEAAEPPAPTHTWPDPLDLHNDEEPIQKDEVKTETETDSTQQNEGIDTSSTPFLTDTKVDKRPLGAFADAVGEPENPGAETPSFRPVNAQSSVPPEVEADLVSIESNETFGNEAESMPEIVNSQEVTSKESNTQPASISQQYNSPDKAVDNDSHSVFDTDAYHQPLLPQKTHGKSRAWVWTLIIIGLLVIGAGLGALFFMAGY